MCVWFILGYASQQAAAQQVTEVIINTDTPQSNAISGNYNEDLVRALGIPTQGLIPNTTAALDEAVSFDGTSWAEFNAALIKAADIDENGTPGATYQIKFNDQGRPGLNGIAMAFSDQLLQQRTASGVVFAIDQFEKLTQPAAVYAQSQEAQAYFPGIGFQLLSPIQSFWGWSVTVAYSFMILIILVIAFGLLFQARLDGKNVVQLKNAIPNVVLAMVLIPLSYPLAGLFIDGITLGTNVIHGVLFSPSGIAGEFYRTQSETANTQTDCLTNSQLTYVGGEQTGTVTAETGDMYDRCSDDRGLYADDSRLFFLDSRSLMRANFTTDVFVTCQQDACKNAIAGKADNPALGVTSQLMQGMNVASDVVGGIINLIFGIITLVVVVKIGWRLLKKFLTLMFLPMFGPFIFATVALPGQGTKGIMDNFIKPLGAATAAYVVAYGALLLTLVFTSPGFINTIVPGGDQAVTAGVFYAPPILFPSEQISPDQQGTSTGGGLNPAFVFMLLGVGIFLSIPPILDGIDKQLGIKSELPAFLATPLAEFNSAADIGLRQGGAVARRTANIGGRSAQGLYRGYFNRVDPNNPTADTAGESMAKGFQGFVERARLAESQGGISGALAGAVAGGTQSFGNRVMKNLTGVDNAVGSAAATSDKPFKGEILLSNDFDKDQTSNIGFKILVPVDRNNSYTDYRLGPIGSSYKGKLVVKAAGESGNFPGPVELMVRTGNDIIAEYEFESSVNGKSYGLQIKASKTRIQSDFATKKELSFDIEFNFSGLGDMLPNDIVMKPFKPKEGKEIQALLSNVEPNNRLVTSKATITLSTR